MVFLVFPFFEGRQIVLDLLHFLPKAFFPRHAPDPPRKGGLNSPRFSPMIPFFFLFLLPTPRQNSFPCDRGRRALLPPNTPLIDLNFFFFSVSPFPGWVLRMSAFPLRLVSSDPDTPRQSLRGGVIQLKDFFFLKPFFDSCGPSPFPLPPHERGLGSPQANIPPGVFFGSPLGDGSPFPCIAHLSFSWHMSSFSSCRHLPGP